MAPFPGIKFSSEIHTKLKSQEKRKNKISAHLILGSGTASEINSALLCSVWLPAKIGRWPISHLTNSDPQPLLSRELY